MCHNMYPTARIRAFAVVLLLIAAVGQLAALGSASGNTRAAGPYYFARGDPRLCPSPMCGGFFVRLVNERVTRCPDGALRRECYVARVDMSRLRIGQEERAKLTELLAAGRGLVRGPIVQGEIEAFPELGVLVAQEGWQGSSSPRPPTGVFRRLSDNGVRCITTPCYSIRTHQLNSRRHGDISDVDLSQTGAPKAERIRALMRIAEGDLIAAGRLNLDSDVGPAGDGRVLLASQFYVRVGRG
jgi:hypothetical protein